MRSDTRPQTGLKRNCISEKTENSTPITCADAERPQGRSAARYGFGLPRHHRQHDAEAEQVDEHGEKHDGQRTAGAGAAVGTAALTAAGMG